MELKQSSSIKKIRTEATKGLLQELDRFIEENRDLNLSNLSEVGMLEKIMTDVRRGRLEFDATLFFVVVFGPLKAGKSTMVNALARKYVSPTRLGKECTLRPSIVVQSKETGIDEYFTISPNADQDKAFHTVIDYLRGIIDESELRKTIRKESASLTGSNVERKLTDILDMEPLITVVRVPGGNLVQNDIAILDMPGLDGTESNWHNSPVHSWIINRSDFLIFIQSSIAALNHDTLGFLEKVIQESKNPPLWLVQNIIDAKHWRDEQERKAEAVRQKMDAKRAIIRKLHISDDLPSTEINLGMADDGIFAARPELLEKSGFEGFEAKLRDVLDQGRAWILERNSIKNIEKVIQWIQPNLEEGILRTEEAIKEHKQTIQDLDQAVTLINQLNYKDQTVYNKLSYDLSTSFTDRQEDWLKGLEEVTRGLQTQTYNKAAGKAVNDILRKYLKEAAAMIEEPYFDNFGSFGTEVKLKVNDALKSVEKEYVAEVNQLLSSHDFPVLTDFYAFNNHDIPKVDLTELSLDSVQERVLLFFHKKYKDDQVKSFISDAQENIMTFFEEQKEVWLREFKSFYLNKFSEMRRMNMRKHVEKEKLEYTEKMFGQLEKWERTLKVMRKFQLSFETIDKLTEDAVVATVGKMERVVDDGA